MMNQILQEILTKRRVTDGIEEFPLDSNMDAEEGALITAAFRTAQPNVSLEVGFAYGISTLFACDALKASGKAATHHVLDPLQQADWRGIGLRNIHAAGYGNMVKLHEVRSEIGLPQLLGSGVRIQAAIIDGWHTFDHTLIDFFYINKMLDVGGIIVLDDIAMPAVAKCARHILSYPCYRLFGQVPEPRKTSVLGRARRQLSRVLPSLRRPWDQVTAMAFQKVAPDERNWDWHAPF